MNESQISTAEKDMGELQRTYQLALSRDNPAVEALLKDLALFCGAVETPAVLSSDKTLDVNRTLVMLGRHEVFMRVARFLNLTTSELVHYYYQRNPRPGAVK